MAQRILGMGDLLTLIDKANEEMGDEDTDKFKEKLKKGTFDLQDFVEQLRKVRRMGPLGQLVEERPHGRHDVERPVGVLAGERVPRAQAVLSSCAAKAQIVEADEREGFRGRWRLGRVLGDGRNVLAGGQARHKIVKLEYKADVTAAVLRQLPLARARQVLSAKEEPPASRPVEAAEPPVAPSPPLASQVPSGAPGSRPIASYRDTT